MQSIKKLSLILASAFMLVGVSMADEGRDGKRNFDPKERAEKMTERMVKEYNLNDVQKQQLLDLNQSITEKMGERPMAHRHGQKVKEGRMGKDNKGEKKNKDGKVEKENRVKRNKDMARADRQRRKNRLDAPKMSTEEREKMHQEMKETRDYYNAQLQKIMNADQYQAFTKKQAEREQKRNERGDKMKENRTKKPGSHTSSKEV